MRFAAIGLDHRVPCAPVGVARKHDLRAPPQRGMEQPVESFEEPLLGCIADRVARGECAEADIDPDDRPDRCDVPERQLRHEASFEPPEGRMVDPGSGGSRAQAEAGTDAPPPDLLRHPAPPL